ncbi:NifU homolog involved in Fe-S cluster formation [Devosia crocina]|uniref:NifU homolog involved in Fe-S cluster formation n=1 Tax=Devosia crocina TaxID=429728 RepID=A0A1I7N8S9_9HYPH|nr:iron-sulfur cluster assembly scaffold protein [Devosia crocina]SFV31065.1 NifU homolog involved in Fe-S cluster formation [Devosia crocina]
MALSELYSDRILEIAGNAVQPGRLPDPAASARKVSRVCGSMIEVDITLSDGVITAYGHEVSACALGQTSAAIVAKAIVGTSVAEFTEVSRRMLAMLRDNGAPPEGKWSDLGFLQPAREFPARHASTMLVFDAVIEAIEKLESDQHLASKV